MKCPKCNNEAIWCENKEIYGKNYGKSYMMWLCKPCDMYVGCHNNTKVPLGIMSDKETRKLKMEVKNMWIKKTMGDWNRTGHNKKGKHYFKLSQQLGIPIEKTHFGLFDKETLLKVKELLK